MTISNHMEGTICPESLYAVSLLSFSFSPASIQLPSLPPSNNGKENQTILLIWLSYFWVNGHFLHFLRQGRPPIVLSLLNAGMFLCPTLCSIWTCLNEENIFASGVSACCEETEILMSSLTGPWNC